MKLLIPFITLFLVSLTSYGQTDKQNHMSFHKANSVQVELFGHGLFYSINYERIMLNSDKFKSTGQIGISIYPLQTLSICIPTSINELISFNQHHIEIGIGHVFIRNQVQSSDWPIVSSWEGFFTGRLGYRFQKPDGKWLYRIGFTPLLDYKGFKEIHPHGSISVGYNF